MFTGENHHDCSIAIYVLVFLAVYSQTEDHYIYQDAQGKLVISNQQPSAGSNVLRKLDLPQFREAQMQKVQEISSIVSTDKLKSSLYRDQKQ